MPGGLQDIGVRAIIDGLSGYKRGMDEMDRKTKTLSKTTGRLQKAAKTAAGALTGLAFTGLLAGAQMAAKFDTQMREVNSLLNLSEKEFQQLKKDVRALSTEMGIAADQVVPGLYQAISAGIPRENVLEFLRVAGKASIGGVTDLETAVDGLTTVVNAFGMDANEAGKVADVMFTAVKLGKTTFRELSQSMFQAAPLAASMGIAFEEVAASAATLTKAGVPTRVAMTQIRQAMVALQKPNKEMAFLLQQAGFESGTAAVETLGFQGTLNKLEETTRGNKEQFTAAFGSVEAFGAVLGLTGDNAVVAAKDLKTVTEEVGAIDKAVEEMEKGAGRRFERLLTRVKNLGIGFAELAPGLIFVGAAAGRAGPLVRALGNAFAFLAGALFAKAIPALIAFAATPLGAIILGIGAMIAIVTLMILHWDKVKEVFVAVSTAIFDAYKSKWGWLLPGGPLVKAIIFLRSKWGEEWNAIKVIAVGAITAIVTAFAPLFGMFVPGGGLLLVLLAFKGEWGAIWDAIVQKYNSAVNNIISVGNAFAASWHQVWANVGKSLASAANGIIARINAVTRAISQIPLVNIPRIDSFAHGGRSQGGPAMVGERGPEIVNLPAGAQVTPINQTTFNVNANYSNPQQPQSIAMDMQALLMMTRS